MGDPAKPAAGGTGPGNLTLRIASALVLIPVALAAVWFGGIWFTLLVALVALTGAAEWRAMAGLEARGVGTVLLTAPLFTLLAAQVANPPIGLIVLAVALVVAAGTFASNWAERRWAMVALVHLGLPVLALVHLRGHPGPAVDLVFFLFASVWLADIGGYAVGRTVGGPWLAPAVSPNKTWAGLAGALAFPAAGAFAFAHWSGLAPLPLLAAALVLAFVAQAGDLFESWIKRRFGVKDSGNTIPGHGGVLDRVDGVMFAAPVMVLVTVLFGAEFIQWR